MITRTVEEVRERMAQLQVQIQTSQDYTRQLEQEQQELQKLMEPGEVRDATDEEIDLARQAIVCDEIQVDNFAKAFDDGCVWVSAWIRIKKED
jgi:hypothetical protein